MVLPEGFALPPLPYLLLLVIGAVLVAAGLWLLDPPVSDRSVLALVPWMGVGGAFHVLYVTNIAPFPYRHVLGTPAVYLATAVLVGAIWIGVSLANRPPEPIVGVVGVIVLVIGSITVLASGQRMGTIELVLPIAGLLGSVLLSAVVWLVLVRAIDELSAQAQWSGMAMVFGHVLDAVSTAIGIDVVGAGERSPVPRAIMDAAGTLPVADAIGVGWAFVIVKIAVAAGVLWLFVPFVKDTPRQAYLLIAALAALGLGPGVHNLLLFTLAG